MREKVNGLQSLRAIASMLVVIDHAITQLLYFKSFGNPFDSILSNIKDVGTIGVYVFFILSGYIMLFSTANRQGFNDAIDFLKKRVVRIYPVYWFWLTFILVLWGVGLALKQHNFNLDRILTSYLLLPYSSGDGGIGRINPILSQGWTLIYEMAFYIVFSLAIIIKRNSNTVLVFVALSFMVLNAVGYSISNHENAFHLLFYSAYFYLFLIGMIIFKFREFIAKIVKAKHVITGFMLFLFLLSFCIIFFSAGRNELVLVLFACMLFILFLEFDITSKTLSALGDSSYSLYLSHGIIAMFYGMIIKKYIDSNYVSLLLVIPVFLSSIVFGHLAYLIVERKFNAYFKVSKVNKK